MAQTADEEFAKMMERLNQVRESDNNNFDAQRDKLAKDIEFAMTKTVKASAASEKAANGLKRGVSNLLPSPKDMMDSITTNHPGLNMLSKATGSAVNGIKTARENRRIRKEEKQVRIDGLDDMLAQLMAIQKPEEQAPIEVEQPDAADPIVVETESAVPMSFATVEASLDRVITNGDRQNDILLDLYEAWEGTKHIMKEQLDAERMTVALAENQYRLEEEAYRMNEEIQRQRDHADANEPKPQDMPSPEVETEPKQKKGFFQNVMETIGEMFISGGVLLKDKVGKLLGSAGKFGKVLGGVATVLTVVYDFLDGFISPEEILGRASEGIRDRMIAGYTSVAAGLGSIVDWIGGFAGLELGTEKLIKKAGRDIANNLRELFEWLPGAVSKVTDMAMDAVSDMLEDVTKYKDQAFAALGGTKKFIADLMTDITSSISAWVTDIFIGMKNKIPFLGADDVMPKTQTPLPGTEPISVPKYESDDIRKMDDEASAQTEAAKQKAWQDMLNKTYGPQANNGSSDNNSYVSVDAKRSNVNNTTNFVGGKPSAYNDDPTLMRINRFSPRGLA